MRNQYPGVCYRCGEHVAAGEGHFEIVRGNPQVWLTQHAKCAIEHRGSNQGRAEAIERARQAKTASWFGRAE